MKKYFHFVLISFIILFLELLLIRLIGTEIRIFAYLSNIVLLAIFIGSGLGMLMKKKFSPVLSAVLLSLVVFIVTSGIFSNITNWLAPLSENIFWFQANYWTAAGVLFGLILTALLFFLILSIFIPLGQYLGNLFESSSQTILAYSINVAASIAGMWAFYGFSWLKFSPLIGIIICQALLILLVQEKARWQIFKIILVSTVIILVSFQYEKQSIDPPLKNVWSAYQKLTLRQMPEQPLRPPGYLLQVNNVGYMGLLDISDGYKNQVANSLKDDKKILENINNNIPGFFDLRFADQYVLPFILKPDASDVLIIGAGGGNDVAGALRSGVKSIDAVEIDREIIKLGQIYHPEKPYASPLVKIIIDDGRSYLRQTDKKYDIVIMGLADSHTLTSSLTDVRLDHYLYTEESFAEIKRILKPDGLLFVTFNSFQPWIGERINQTIVQVFKHKPLVFNVPDTAIFGWAGTVYTTSPDESAFNGYLEKNQDFKKFTTANQKIYNNPINSLTDNWPYLYLDKPRLPTINLILILFLAAIFLLFRKTVSWQGNFNWQMFFLGAGFLLYEFQNINKTSLLFGNTWVTNLFTVTAILLFILLANLLQAKKPLPLKISYLGLFLAFLLEIFLPLSWLNSLPFLTKIIFSSFILNLPLFFSATIFITLFSSAKEKSANFASNLIGSAAGGMLEIFSFLLGVKSLLFISLAFYILSAIFFLPLPKNIKSIIISKMT
ncbi:MAG: methyltransferase domain-containing protein [bacterium]|nr:methyltransferase domain-containing protein [bacterium]